MYSRRWLMVALAILGLASGCESFNTNLTTQSSSSTLASLAPAATYVATVPSDGLTINAYGTGFVLGAFIVWNEGPNEVQFNTTQYPTTFVNSGQLSAVIPASFFPVSTTVQTIAIAVQIPGSAQTGTSGASSTNTTELSNLVIFNINPSPTTPPTISSLSPLSIGAGSGAFTLTVTGTNFVNASVVNWNGSQRATTFVSSTRLTASILASDVAAIGTANVSVSNAASGGATTSSLLFTITSNAPTPAASRRLAITAGDQAQPSPGVSADRRFVVFAMASTDGVTLQPGTAQNIFVRDTCQGAPDGCVPATSLVSVGIDGGSSGDGEGNGDSVSYSISADGRYVAFVSSATNLVENDTNGVADVFVRDLCTGGPAGCVPSTQRVSISTDGTQATEASGAALISASGRFITFSSQAANLDPAFASGSSGFSGIFVRDTCAGAPAGCTPSTQLLKPKN